MITLDGTYTEGLQELEYVCRVIPYHGDYYDPIGRLMTIDHGDVLYMLGKGTWFALYQTHEKRLQTLESLNISAMEQLNNLPTYVT
jgi:hypothetical protein